MEKKNLSNYESKFLFIKISDTIARRIKSLKQFDINCRSKFIEDCVLNHDLVICYDRLGFALCFAKPYKELARTKGPKKIRFFIVEIFATPIIISDLKEIPKNQLTIIRHGELSADLKNKLNIITAYSESNIENSNDKMYLSQIGLAENITGGALVTFVANWLYNIIRIDLHLEEIVRLIGTLILGTIYVTTYYVELKKISREEIIKISSFDYLLLIANFFCVHFMMLFIKNASLFSWLIVLLVIIDFVFILYLIKRYNSILSEISIEFILYRWWILTDVFLAFLLISVCLLFIYIPQISALTNLGMFLLIFLMDEYVKRALSKYYK
jgi:hypothetical protein